MSYKVIKVGHSYCEQYAFVSGSFSNELYELATYSLNNTVLEDSICSVHAYKSKHYGGEGQEKKKLEGSARQSPGILFHPSCETLEHGSYIVLTTHTHLHFVLRWLAEGSSFCHCLVVQKMCEQVGRITFFGPALQPSCGRDSSL